MPPHKNKDRKSGKHKNDITIPRDPTYTSFGHRNQAPLAQRLRTTLVYNTTVARTGLAFYDYIFRLNSLFDPDLTGAGHQPKGFDQLAALYQRYRVFKARFRVIFAPTTASMPVHCVCVPTNSSTSYTDASDAIEAPYSKNELAVIYYNKKLTGSVDLAVLNGKSHAAYASDDTTQALISTNPSEVLNLHVFTEAADASTAVTLYFAITIHYDVEFSDPVQLGQS